MIWCIVNEEAYRRAKRQYGSVQKIANAPGSEVFETQADAEAFIREAFPGKGLGAHPIRADWQRDSAPTGMIGVHRLLVDAEIIR